MSALPATAPFFTAYHAPDCYDEMFGFGEAPLAPCAPLHDALRAMSGDEPRRRAAQADGVFRDVGITFTLTADEQCVERTLPFDPLPRLAPTGE